MAIVAPSILSADFAHLSRDCQMVVAAGAQYLHIDVMDGMFVPNITIGPCVIRSLRRVCDAVFDVHLMICKPERYIDDFAAAGADILTLHTESTQDIGACLEKIKSHGIKSALTIKPNTPVAAVEPYLSKVDMVLVMTVEPGFGGQTFMPDMIPKIEHLARRRGELGLGYLIEVDGGVGLDNANLLTAAGADVLVAGNAVFGAADPAAVITQLINS